MQVPSIDQVHEHGGAASLEEVLASVNAVHAYDRKRRHRRRKRFLFYGRITTGYERGPPRGSTTGSAKASTESSGGHYHAAALSDPAHAVSHWECAEKQRGISTTQAALHNVAFFNTSMRRFVARRTMADANGVELAS